MAKNRKFPNNDIIGAVGCPRCGARKREACHRHTYGAFAVERGPICGPHQERLTLYRRKLYARSITTRVEQRQEQT
jgi:hypothetical protein